MKQKITAIIVTNDKEFLKYRLLNTPRQVESFERFARTKGAAYINYYDKATRAFIRRSNIAKA